MSLLASLPSTSASLSASISASISASPRAAALAATLLAACGGTTHQLPDAPAAPTLTTIATFDPAKGQLPEGVVVDGDAAYVGMAPLGQIVRVALSTGATAPFATLPAPEAGKGFMTGLVIHDGYLYAALVSFVPTVAAGVYRVPLATGGAATLFASNPGMAFPNDLDFDAAGDLYVTDSGAGAIFRAPAAGGQAAAWLTDPLLRGQQGACGAGTGAGFDIGANGMVVEADAIYAVNTDKATLIRVPRTAGAPGTPVIVGAADCANLGGADGLVRAGDHFLATANRQNKIVRITATGAATTVVDSGLDFPATLAPAGDAWVGTSFAFASASSGGAARPALFRLTER